MDDIEGFDSGMKISLQNILSNACLKQREMCGNTVLRSVHVQHEEDAIDLRREMFESELPKGL